METSKNKPRKISEFGKRIIKVLTDNGLVKPNGEVNYSEAERLCGLTSSILSKAVTRQGLHKENFKKFHSYFHVEPYWLKTGKGEIKAKNGTAAIKKEQADILDDPLVKSFTEQINLQKKMIEMLEKELADCKSGKKE